MFTKAIILFAYLGILFLIGSSGIKKETMSDFFVGGKTWAIGSLRFQLEPLGNRVGYY